MYDNIHCVFSNLILIRFTYPSNLVFNYFEQHFGFLQSLGSKVCRIVIVVKRMIFTMCLCVDFPIHLNKTILHFLLFSLFLSKELVELDIGDAGL